MTIQEAKESIGKEFCLLIYTKRFDIIRSVDEHGWVIGDFMEAPASDVRLKQEQPEQLKKDKTNK